VAPPDSPFPDFFPAIPAFSVATTKVMLKDASRGPSLHVFVFLYFIFYLPFSLSFPHTMLHGNSVKILTGSGPPFLTCPLS